MENFKNEYDRICSLGSPTLIGNELKQKSAEFCNYYKKLKKKQYNTNYRDNKINIINENRRANYQASIASLILKEPPAPTAPKVPQEPQEPKNEIIENMSPIFMKLLVIYIKYNPNMKDPVSKVNYIMDYINKKPYSTQNIYKYHSYLENCIDDIFEHNPDDLLMLHDIFHKFTGRISVLGTKIKNKLIKEKLLPEPIDIYKNSKEDMNIDFDDDTLTFNYLLLKEQPLSSKMIYIMMFLHNPKLSGSQLKKGIKYENIDLTTLSPLIAEELETYKDFDWLFRPTYDNNISKEFQKITNIIYGFPFSIKDIKSKFYNYTIRNSIDQDEDVKTSSN